MDFWGTAIETAPRTIQIATGKHLVQAQPFVYALQ